MDSESVSPLRIVNTYGICINLKLIAHALIKIYICKKYIININLLMYFLALL